jgi:hypothetical protein
MATKRWSLLAVASLLLGGCLSSSIAGDVADVRARTRVPVLADVADLTVAHDSDGDARSLLEAPLDADTAVRVALLNNRALRAQLRELGVARGRLIQARQIANPTFEAESLPERNTAFELRVEYDLTSLVLAPLRAKAAAADLQVARLDVAGDVVQLHGEDTRWKIRSELPPVPDYRAAVDEPEAVIIKASLELHETRQRLEGWRGARAWHAWRAGCPMSAVDVHALHGNPEDGAAGGSRGPARASPSWRPAASPRWSRRTAPRCRCGS